ncbi:hypothetical protein MKZ38_005596 [Zalerion maritima]|uniref:FAS1 domain-containing protein n=1 Tax=Zalerion maritima TaxID=339359 RepID=A0AAD5RJZ5_9PEZI|nr:hypothetical protein MKZ38_005596 [Zalerion maritima]
MRACSAYTALLALWGSALSQTLLDALINAGASDFAAALEADPDSLAEFDKLGKTIFAPKDATSDRMLLLAERDLPRVKYQGGDKQEELYTRSSTSTTTTAATSTGEAKVRRAEPTIDVFASNFETMDELSNLGPITNTTVVVEDGEFADEGASSLKHRSTSIFARAEGANATTVVKTGLGNTVAVLQANIPFENGLIHLVDGYFTDPQPLSVTAETNGYTSYLDLLTSSGSKDYYDQIPRTTFFIPSDDAFAAATIPTDSDAEKQALLAEHVFTGYLGYTPTLAKGGCFTNMNGRSLQISAGEDGGLLVGDAKIIMTNVILENGVAHVIDKVLGPDEPTTTATGSAATGTPTVVTAGGANNRVRLTPLGFAPLILAALFA